MLHGSKLIQQPGLLVFQLNTLTFLAFYFLVCPGYKLIELFLHAGLVTGIALAGLLKLLLQFINTLLRLFMRGHELDPLTVPFLYLVVQRLDRRLLVSLQVVYCFLLLAYADFQAPRITLRCCR